MRDVLIGPHDDHTADFTVNVAHGEDVVAAFDIGAKYLFVILKSITSLVRHKQRRHRFDGELTMSLLKNRADINNSVDIFSTARIFSDGRFLILGEKIAQSANG